MRPLDLLFPADDLSVRQALDTLRAGLTPLVPSNGALGQIELVLAEVLNNIVEHAYDHTTTGTIRLRCQRDIDQIVIHITDQGRPFPDLKLPAGACPDIKTPAAGLPEGGFGWFLIFQLAKTVHYQRRNDQNHLQLIFTLPACA